MIQIKMFALKLRTSLKGEILELVYESILIYFQNSFLLPSDTILIGLRKQIIESNLQSCCFKLFLVVCKVR